MGGPTDKPAAVTQIRQLTQVVQDVIHALRRQQDILRQHGMSLPPGTLAGLKHIRDEMLEVLNSLQNDATELEQLRALAQTTALVNSSLDINEVLNEVMDTVIALTGAERGYIVLRDEETDQLEFRIARNLDRETLDQGEFIVSKTIVGEVAQTGEPVLTTNALADPHYSAQESVMIHALRSILCVPLVHRDRVIGVVYVDNRVRDAVFGDKHRSLLVAFASQAAIAIENARLFDRVQTALNEITAMKELMDNVFASIASGVITTDTAETITIYNDAAGRILNVPSEQALGYPLVTALPVLYSYIKGLLGGILEHSRREIVEIAPNLPERGEANLTLKLSPLRDRDVIEGAAIVVDDLTEIKKRDATLDVVRRYLPPAMLDNIQSLDGLGLGGERRTITTLFVEVRPFHAFPAHLPPQELMELLNLYLSVGSESIHNQNGVIDKYMGNEIMGLFNTQLNPAADHSWAAVQAALKMADGFLHLAEQLGEEPTPHYRIGIHTGIATLGNVGSATRREFTAIGDTVNLAKRLQENAAPGQIILSDVTYHQCHHFIDDPANKLLTMERGHIYVKGRSQATRIYQVERKR